MKSILSKIALGLAVSLLLVGGAEAAKLYSPPLRVEFGESLECKILNASDKTRTVRIDMRTDDNGLSSDVLMVPTEIAPGEVVRWSNQAGPCFGTMLPCIPSWCQFTVSGSKNNYRASACVHDGGGCRAAVEAR